MSEKYKERVTVVYQSCIAAGVYSIWLQTAQIAAAAVPGQFVSVYSNNASRILPRPISICEINKNSGMIRLVYRVVGEGTEEFSHLVPGDSVDIMGPLGNGFSLQEKSALLIGGGVGIAPLLYFGQEIVRMGAKPTFLLGARSESDLLELEEFRKLGQVLITTEDGSAGEQGFVTNHSVLQHERFDQISTCGPNPMMKAVARVATELGMRCEASLENMMACGVGACLCCVEKTTEGNLCVCKEGPVFDVKRLLW